MYLWPIVYEWHAGTSQYRRISKTETAPAQAHETAVARFCVYIYPSTYLLTYKSWEEKLIGKDKSNSSNEGKQEVKKEKSSCNNSGGNGDGNIEDIAHLRKCLEEVLGTFVKNGKISHSLWAQHKMFIGDEGLYLLGEVVTICQIVQFIDSDDIEDIPSNEDFKKEVLEEVNRKLILKRKKERMQKRIRSNLSMRSDNNNYSYGNFRTVENEEEDEEEIDAEEDTYDSELNDDMDDDLNLSDKNAVTNFVEMLCSGKTNKYGFCEYDQKFNEKYNLKNLRNDQKSSKSIQHSVLPFSEDYSHKYICLLLNHSGKQEIRILRFRKDCTNTNKLLETLKGTVIFLNELRFLFKFFRSQVVLKDRIYGEFCAYIKFHRSDPNFSGTKAMNEFFNSLNDSALKQLFFGLNEQNLNLLEEAISYCPIATFAFFKNIKLLKNINVNATRRTWKAVCGLQKLYKNLKKVKEKEISLEDARYTTDEDKKSSLHRNVTSGEVIPFSRSPGNTITNSNDPNIFCGSGLNAVNDAPSENINPGCAESNEHSDKAHIGSDSSCIDNDISSGSGGSYGNAPQSCDVNKLNETCMYITSDEENLKVGKRSINHELVDTSRDIEENNKTLFDEGNKMVIDSNYKTVEENKLMRENSIDDLRVNMVKLFKTYGGQCRIGKVQGRCEDATFQTDIPPAFGIFDGVGSWSLEGIDASKFSIGLSLACQREAEKLSKNLNGYAKVSYNTIIRSKLLLKNSLESVKKEYADAYGSSTAIVGLIDEYTGKCGISSLGDSVCMVLRREFLPGDINFERETYPKFPVESFLYYNTKGRNPSIVRKVIWKTSDQKWENGAPYQLSNLPDRSQWKDLEDRGLHSFVKILEKVDIDGDSPDMALTPPSEILCMPGDLILLMSDGVSDNLFDEEIEAYCTFAISPEEACELGDPSAYTPAQDIAYSITNIAKRRSGDKLHCKPFYPFSGKYKDANRLYKGNKVDDISCVAIWVVCETEESIKKIITNPSNPYTLETDKYYTNNYFQHFNKLTDICTPTKTFIKEKNKIDRVNLQKVKVDSTKNSQQGSYARSNGSHMPSQFSTSFFDSSETPIKFNTREDSNYQDLSDIVLKDADDEEEEANAEGEMDGESAGEADGESAGEADGESAGEATVESAGEATGDVAEEAAEEVAEEAAEEAADETTSGGAGDEVDEEARVDKNGCVPDKCSVDTDAVKTPNSNVAKAKFKNKIFPRAHFDHTPKQRISDDRLNEHIERINNMYIKTPILHIDDTFKSGKGNMKKGKSTSKCKINKAAEKKNVVGMMHYETPKKQTIKGKEKQNAHKTVDESPVMMNFLSNETPVKSFGTRDTTLKVDKKIVKAKRKSIFSSEKGDSSPGKLGITSKRTKRA
ncbi:protein phosphatase, putative [Plasmodium ovale wallikeri]|uniref:Protein phosphatase, putative n=1 Tax=Plasmodium ovale wallikeri TaxID=864142 RepID=A0A1A8ZKP1_PLAOA|nr:protein phosphatase, putative [Plasmodium ovale wallikeri]